MSVTFSEKFKSRRTIVGTNPSTELVYNAVVEGETDEDLAIAAAVSTDLPSEYDSKPLNAVEIEQLGNDLWQVTLTFAYSRGSFVLPTGGSASSFDTTGGTRRITQSLETVSLHAPPTQTAPDFGGAIGVSENGIEGVEIAEGGYRFREIRIVADADVDAAFKATIYGLTKKVNSETWQGYEPGEVLFEGATGTQRGEDDWEIVYSFIANPNAEDLQVGDITGIDKDGWDYLWVLYGDEVDGAAGAMVKRPLAAYVERVYYRGDFADLGL